MNRKKKHRTMLIIGLGRFGSRLALTLEREGQEVMVIDVDEATVNKIAPLVTSAQIGDCTDQWVVEDLDVSSYDVCFVCISNQLETSLVITTLLQEYGAQKIVTKVNTDIHAKLLLHNGADDVIYPERDMAFRTAMKYSATKAFDYLELTDSYGIFEIDTPTRWVGHSIKEINVRKNYGVNIIAYKSGDVITGLDREEYFFKESDHLIIAGDRGNFKQLIDEGL